MIKRWNRRYFKAINGELFYYPDNKTVERPLGQIRLRGSEINYGGAQCVGATGVLLFLCCCVWRCVVYGGHGSSSVLVMSVLRVLACMSKKVRMLFSCTLACVVLL